LWLAAKSGPIGDLRPIAVGGNEQAIRAPTTHMYVVHLRARITLILRRQVVSLVLRSGRLQMYVSAAAPEEAQLIGERVSLLTAGTGAAFATGGIEHVGPNGR
jgi:hypothetical protein